jgi:[glutamine synthetase] adenylyltransferase / [glutamine synthetase]-adenylyl-L-tyrosine phosphorylase
VFVFSSRHGPQNTETQRHRDTEPRKILFVEIVDAKLESLLRDLPDENGARAFLQRLADEHPRDFQKLKRDPALFSDMLALAAWSPLLATTMEQNPDYLWWLSRERANPRIRTREELKESLARFALTNSSLNEQVMLARFRRRELLRIYLHDIRRIQTLVETTEELSNLADAILDYSLNLAKQNLDNRFGFPRRTDERGRTALADFCVIALGKLGSYELNYASDIDLVFIYSDEGTTSGTGERGEVTNREYFVKLAEAIVKLAGQPAGEGAAYRVDLRLRPHGRDGALACSLDEATRYYRQTAQQWELQAMIRSRASAGSASLFSQFAASIRPSVFRSDVSVRQALASVRLAKQKIDRQAERRSGFNVKLSRGGIREIEFIAQALQLAHGGNDEWLRVPHTLVSLGRLADRGFITEQERTELSAAYTFLRTLEHRLQMEHGLQTHTLPDAVPARRLAARRMGFKGETAVQDFEAALNFHTENVSRAYTRVFVEADGQSSSVAAPASLPEPLDLDANATAAAARVFVTHLQDKVLDPQSLSQVLSRAARESLNPHRSATIAARIAASLDKSAITEQLTEDNLVALMRLAGSSEFFGEMIAANPVLISSLTTTAERSPRRDYRAILRTCIDAEKTLSDELTALRRAWSRLLLEIGVQDAVGEISVFESNRRQTELAIASLNVAYLIARRELGRRFGRVEGGPGLAFLGLGRLGSGGVDYGSDLDIIITYDALVPSPIASLSREEAYGRLVELMISALSSITREGYLYRVDLRLRPHGKNGPLIVGTDMFLEYVREQSAIWEWLAYVKLRAIAGDLEVARRVETHSRHLVHEIARQANPEELKRETRHVRDRLEKEKGQGGSQGAIDIKYGNGGMLDVYFVTRYLQLRDDVPDEGEDRSTRATIDRLEALGSIAAADAAALSDGYALLRSVDHHLRLIVGRSTKLPAPDHPAARDLASKLGFVSAGQLNESLRDRMKEIRSAYDRILA